MRFRLVLLFACALVMAGCQTPGGVTQSSTPGAPATGASPATAGNHAGAASSPWAMARARGMVFRATGSHPAWSVEVSASHTPSLFVVINDSQRKLQVPDATVASDQASGTVTFQGSAGDGTPVELTIHRGQCQADMRGKKSAAAVELDVGASQYTGCGRFLLR